MSNKYTINLFIIIIFLSSCAPSQSRPIIVSAYKLDHPELVHWYNKHIKSGNLNLSFSYPSSCKVSENKSVIFSCIYIDDVENIYYGFIVIIEDLKFIDSLYLDVNNEWDTNKLDNFWNNFKDSYGNISDENFIYKDRPANFRTGITTEIYQDKTRGINSNMTHASATFTVIEKNKAIYMNFRMAAFESIVPMTKLKRSFDLSGRTSNKFFDSLTFE